MKIHQMIQKKRKEEGMTQEQVAKALGVSTPAVNKWENGNSCPDIELLCPLARLLKIDANELLGFREELTRKEITDLSQSISEAIHNRGMEEGMKQALEIIREYPNCSLLIYNLALTIEGQAVMEGLEIEPYAEIIQKWYIQCSQCEDQTIRNQALYMLASKYIAQGEFAQAEDFLNRIPDQEENNKDLLKVNILLGKGAHDHAAELLERMLQKSMMAFQMNLWKLIDAELYDGNEDCAKSLAKIWRNIAKSLGVWEYNWYVADFQIAVETKDMENSLKYMEAMLKGIQMPVNAQDSPLSYRLYRKEYGTKKEENAGKKMLPVFIHDLKTNQAYDFLRSNPKFHEILENAMRE